MNINEFRNWLRESHYKVIGEYPESTTYSRGFSHVDLYNNGNVVVTFCSMLEFTVHKTNVKDIERMHVEDVKYDSLKYKVVEEVEGEMKECEFYLYCH